MIKSITVTNYLGESVKIVLTNGDPSHGMIIQNISGLGPPKANVSMTDLATMDGALFNSARVEKRNITIQLLFTFAPTIEDARQRAYKYFPIKKPLTLVIETDNRIVETVGVVESNEPDIFSKDESANISIVCPDPFLYSSGENGTNVTIFSGVVPMFEFPFSNESLTEPLLEMGSIESMIEKNIVYTGDSEIGIVIRIHAIGEASNIAIYNTTTREAMHIDTNKLAAITGSGIITGDDIIISTIKGSKSITLIRGGDEINVLNCLEKNADWFQLSRGDNIFAYTAETGITNLQFEIENRSIYEGV